MQKVRLIMWMVFGLASVPCVCFAGPVMKPTPVPVPTVMPVPAAPVGGSLSEMLLVFAFYSSACVLIIRAMK